LRTSKKAANQKTKKPHVSIEQKAKTTKEKDRKQEFLCTQRKLATKMVARTLWQTS